MANSEKAPKWWLIIGALFLVLGIGGCAVGVTRFANIASEVADAPETSYGDSRDFTASSDGVALIFADDANARCDAETEDGRTVALDFDAQGVDETEGLQFVSGFEVDDGEGYRVTCEGPAAGTAGSFVVVRFGIGTLVLGIGGIFGGGAFIFFGIIFLIIGVVRRVRWNNRRKAFAAGGPPMGGPPMGGPPPGAWNQQPGQPGAWPQQPGQQPEQAGWGQPEQQPGWGQPGQQPPPAPGQWEQQQAPGEWGQQPPPEHPGPWGEQPPGER